MDGLLADDHVHHDVHHEVEQEQEVSVRESSRSNLKEVKVPKPRKASVISDGELAAGVRPSAPKPRKPTKCRCGHPRSEHALDIHGKRNGPCNHYISKRSTCPCMKFTEPLPEPSSSLILPSHVERDAEHSPNDEIVD